MENTNEIKCQHCEKKTESRVFNDSNVLAAYSCGINQETSRQSSNKSKLTLTNPLETFSGFFVASLAFFWPRNLNVAIRIHNPKKNSIFAKSIGNTIFLMAHFH